MLTHESNDIKAFAENVTPVQDQDPRFPHFVLQRIPLVKAVGDGCDGVYAELDGSLYPIDSSRVREEVNELFDVWEAAKKPDLLSQSKLRDIIELLRQKGNKIGRLRQVFKRYAYLPDEKAILIDLATVDGNCVKITAEGWAIIQLAKPIFVRYETQKPLPMPVQVGTAEGYAAMQDIVPTSVTKPQLKLMIGTIMAFMLPTNFSHGMTYPVLLLRGSPGSGKTTLMTLIKRMVDNDVAPTAAAPVSVRDFFITSQKQHLPAYDNLDFIKGDVSNAICQITSKGQMVQRKLYSDNAVVNHQAHGPIMLNGIGDVIRRQDIVDRSVAISLERIAQHNPAAADNSSQVMPKVMGYLYNLMAKALANYEQTQVDGLPRLCVMAKFVHAAEPFACPQQFLHLLRDNQRETLIGVDENSPVFEALIRLLTQHFKWSGTYKQLATLLKKWVNEDLLSSDEWPSTPKRLSTFMHHRTLALRESGIEFMRGVKTCDGRMVHLSRNHMFVPAEKEKPEIINPYMPSGKAYEGEFNA